MSLLPRIPARHAVFYIDSTLSQPTSLLAESRAQTTTALQWADNSDSETGFEIDRALGDGSFSLITTTAANVTTFDDSGLAAGTRYRYRVRATDGVSTTDYSNIVTVVTHSCAIDEGFHREMALPRFDSESGEPPDLSEWEKLLNEMVQKIESRFNKQVVTNAPCDLCVTNGAIIIDCARCDNFEVTVDEDINSISMVHCDAPGTETEIVFKTNAERCITGWPDDVICEDCGTINDRECTDGGAITRRRFSTGNSGRPISEGPGTAPVGGSSGGGGGGTGGGLRIQCEATVGGGDFADANVNPCARMNCGDSSPHLNFRARGGLPPYTWTSVPTLTGGVAQTFLVNIPKGTLTLSPGGTGTDDAGARAYTRGSIEWTNSSGACTVCNNYGTQSYRCDGATFSTCLGSSCCDGNADPDVPDCNNADPTCRRPGQGCNTASDCGAEVTGHCADSQTGAPATFQCDCRTQTQKDSGTCEPCALNIGGDDGGGTVLTVTDSLGTSVSITVDMVPA